MYSIETQQIFCESFKRSENANGKLRMCIFSIELTRRCNLNCAHCMKGKSQNLDIPFEYIDEAMSQIGLIYCLALSGGEITLCPDRVRYVLESAKRHNVRIKRLMLTTNGVIMSDEILKIYREFMDFVEMPELSEIIISRDRFHSFESKLTEEDYLKRKLFYEDNGKNKVVFQNVEKEIQRLGNCAKPPKVDIQAYFNDRQSYMKGFQNKYIAYGLSKSRPFIKMPLRHNGKCFCQIDLLATGYIRPNDYMSYKDSDCYHNCNGHINDGIMNIVQKENNDPYCQSVGEFLIAGKNVESISEQIKQQQGLFGLGLFFVNKDKIKRIKQLSLSFMEIIMYMRELVPDVRDQIKTMPEDAQNKMNEILDNFEKVDTSNFDQLFELLEKI